MMSTSLVEEYEILSRVRVLIKYEMTELIINIVDNEKKQIKEKI